MFSRRKKNYNIFLYTALIVAICALVAFLLWPEPVAVSENNDNINVNSQTNTENQAQKEQIKNQETFESTDKNNDIEDKDNELTQTNTKSYYIVKNNDNVISVYFVTEDGKKIKLEDTDILYELLPLEDQNRFDAGIIVENQEKLMTLLQDYES